jgi:hypothetical protein
MLSSGIACQDTLTEEQHAATKPLTIQKPFLRELTALAELYKKVCTLLSTHHANPGYAEIQQELTQTYEWLNEMPLKKPHRFAQKIAALEKQIHRFQQELTPELKEHLTSLIMLSKLIHTQPKNATIGCIIGASTLATIASLLLLNSHSPHTPGASHSTTPHAPHSPPAIPSDPHRDVSASGAAKQPEREPSRPRYTAAELVGFKARLQTLTQDRTLTPTDQNKIENVKKRLEEEQKRLYELTPLP